MTKPTDNRRPLSRLAPLLLIAGVLLVAGVLYFVTHGGSGAVAVIQYGTPQQTMRVPLNQDARYDLESGGYTIHLQVKDGAIAFVDSPCPDHLCEGFGWLSRDGDWAACLPAQASVTVESG